MRNFRKRLGKCREPRAACANVSVSAAELARPAQTSWQMPRYLRSLRKRLGQCRETCAACANVSVNAAVLARLAQTSRQMPWYLRNLRKRLGMGQKIILGYVSMPLPRYGHLPLRPDSRNGHWAYWIQPIDLRPNKQSHQTDNESMDWKVVETILNVISSFLVPVALAYIACLQRKQDKEQKKREQAAIVAEALANWLSADTSDEEERRRLHKSVWEMTIWLPDDLAKKVNDLLAYSDPNVSVRTLLFEVRAYIWGKKIEKEQFRSSDIVFFPQKESPKEES